MKAASTILIALSLAGCMSAPSRQDLDSADYGPFPDRYQQSIRDYMDRVLKDPDSAKYEFYKTPVKAWRRGNGANLYGWATCVGINSKNSYGGYTGSLQSYFFIQENVVMDAQHSSTNDGITTGIVREMCSKL